MEHCSKCGNTVSDDDCFCPKCGAKTRKGIEAGVTMPADEFSEAFSKMGKELDKAFSTAAREIEEAVKTAGSHIHRLTREEPVICSNCGEKNVTSANYCYKCGQKIGGK